MKKYPKWFKQPLVFQLFEAFERNSLAGEVATQLVGRNVGWQADRTMMSHFNINDRLRVSVIISLSLWSTNLGGRHHALIRKNPVMMKPFY